MKEVRRLIKKSIQIFCLIGIDLLAFYTALFLSLLFRTELIVHIFNDLPAFIFSYKYFFNLLWIPLIFIILNAYENLYTNNLPFWDEARRLVKAITLSSLIVMAIVTIGNLNIRFSRIVLLGLWFFSIFIFPIFRLWGKKCLYKLGIWRERVLILGAGNAGRLVAEGISREKHMGYEVIGFLDDDENKKGTYVASKKVFGKVKHLPKFVNDLEIKTVILAMPSLPPEKISAMTAWIQGYAINTIVIPDIKGIALLNTNLLHLFYEEIFLMNITNNLKSPINKTIKRIFDLSLSFLLLPILLPFIGIIGILIKIETPGPAIYAHQRIGKNGKPFLCYKFRTMYKDSEEVLKEILQSNEDMRKEWEENWKLKDDPRITKIGRFLRKTSLDELPQIFNVLKGEMSLIGPRPYLLREKKDVGDSLPIITSTNPGLTGLWQVSGRSNIGYKYRIKLDTWYVMNWSLWLDIAILFRTIRVVVRGEGAF
jgi:Undecaprenyl-phosphate galactose phosphotransferase WbaP